MVPLLVIVLLYFFEDGMIEKQEFLMDLLDIFNDRFVQPLGNRQNNKSVHPLLHHGKLARQLC